MSAVLIDRLDDLPQDLTCEQLACEYFTGSGKRVPDRGGKTRLEYRSGIATAVGDIETGVWVEAIKRLVARNGEQEIYHKLLSWVSSVPWAHTKAEKEKYALQLYADRIWTDPDWVGYQNFKFGSDLNDQKTGDEAHDESWNPAE